MSKRTITALTLLLVGFPALVWGGVPYFLFILFLLTVAGWEYTNLFQLTGSRPAKWPVVVGVAFIAATRFFWPAAASPLLAFLVLVLMAYHLVDYERGADRAGVDFSISLAALIYIGWLGAYLLDLRNLPNGGWWVFFVLPCVWFVDTGAYMIGAAYGRHRMTPRLSPKKTWEGFAGGAFSAVLGGAFFAYCYSTWGPLNLPVWQGALFGLVVGLLTPFGDLGESMLKRQAGAKDSGTIFPGHGGAFDRIDSWLWGAAIGYYFITWFMR